MLQDVALPRNADDSRAARDDSVPDEALEEALQFDRGLLGGRRFRSQHDAGIMARGPPARRYFWPSVQLPCSAETPAAPRRSPPRFRKSLSQGAPTCATEAGFRVPGILHWPGVIKQGQVSDRIVSSLDFLPTFCALAGSPLPKRTLDGTDISGFLKGQGFIRTKPLLWCYYNAINERRVTLRSGDWKILAALQHQGQPLPKFTNVHAGNWPTVDGAALADFELYHLADHSEAVEVSGVFPQRFAGMKQELEQHYRELLQDSHIWNR